MENNINLDELLLLGDDSMCQYSGLPSVSSYLMKVTEEQNEEIEYYTGHS
jgi:hypothetical protein